MKLGNQEKTIKIIFIVIFFITILSIIYTIFSGFFYFNLSKIFNSINNKDSLYSIRLTLITVVVSLIISVIIALPCSYSLSRLNLPFKNIIDTLIDLPIIFPPAVMGIFLLGMINSPIGKLIESLLNVKLVHNPSGIVLVQIAVTTSFGIRILKAVFDSLNPRYEQVSFTLGANYWKVLRYVTLPIALPGLLAAMSIIFVRCIAEFEGLMLFVGAVQGKTDVISLRIFLEFAVGNLEGAFALGAISVSISIATLIFLKKMENSRFEKSIIL